VSRAAYFIFSTPGVVWAMGLGAIWILARPRSSVARRCVAAVAIGYLLASIYLVPATVGGMLARPFHRFGKADVPPGRVALVVFGAGDEDVTGWDRRVVLPNTVGAERVLEAKRVYDLARPEWIVSSGGNPDSRDETEPSGVNMRDMLVELGVPVSRIIVESTSRETHENAQASAAIVRRLGANGVILVTSSVHMRRAIGAMRAAGVSAIPAVAPDLWFQKGWNDWLAPSNHALYFSGEVVHEFLGLAYYRLHGWLQ
jgi:uncharacterized SAM-binding protein YcdF (DUF218 family)